MLRAVAVVGSAEVVAAENVAGRVGTEGGAEVEGTDVVVGGLATGAAVVAGAATAGAPATVAPARSQGFGGEGMEGILKVS